MPYVGHREGTIYEGVLGPDFFIEGNTSFLDIPASILPSGPF